MKRFYGQGLPGVDPSQLRGKLIVIEGPDGSGRSTQVAMLKDWLEEQGHGVTNVGLRRSTLVSKELDQAKQGHVLSPVTFSLFYATDFADQFENIMIPALRSGFVVLADRYIYTPMARDLIRGADPAWLESLYSIALVPDAVFYVRVSPRELVRRNLDRDATLDHWESGMDLGLHRDLVPSFMKYQRLMQAEFKRMQERYGFQVINGNRSIRAVFRELQAKVKVVLGD
jgi:dTMP kinase